MTRAFQASAHGVAVNGLAGGGQARKVTTAIRDDGGMAEDIAHAVSFLASQEAGFITGQRIVVDGGRSLGS
jgi:NAD(P)-dependent dehydrogenase (short-subunit alcohol dehydrogenase family)